MLPENITQKEIQHQAWINAYHFYKTITALAKALGISRKRLSNWINLSLHIPYEYAIIAAALTNIPLALLSPSTKRANQIIEQWRQSNGIFTEKRLESIQVLDSFHYNCSIPAQSILIDAQGQLISGLAQLKAYQAAHKHIIPAIVLDLQALVLGKQALKDLITQFVFSERVAIGLYLMQWAIAHQHSLPLLGNGYLDWDALIANWVGFDCKGSYLWAKQIYLQGVPELVTAVDYQKLSLEKAVELVSLSKAEQYQQLEGLGLMTLDPSFHPAGVFA